MIAISWSKLGPSLRLLLFVAGWMLIHTKAVSCQPSPEEKGIEVTYNISKDAILTCTVKNLNRRRIIWRRLSDPYPISVGGARFSPSRRYRVSSRGETSTLVIRGVNLADAAEYMCEASGGAGPRETLILNIQAGDDTTYFLPSNTTVMAAVGDTVVLPCHVENINERVVLWKDERNQVLSLRKKRLSGDHRKRVIHNIRTEWSMQIKRVTEDDFGFYTCVINTDPVLTRTIELENKEPARFAPVLREDNSFRKRVQVKLGDTVKLACNFNAYPIAKVRWFKRHTDSTGKMVKTAVGTGSTYTLRSVSVAEAGDYVCIGDNGLGKISRGKTRLVVIAPKTTPAPITTTTEFKPDGPASPRLYHVNKVVAMQRGRSTSLECVGVGQPRPKLEWRKHGHKLEKSYKYNLIPSINGRHKSNLKLEIRSLVSRDYGEYECVGHNDLGLISIKFDLKRPDE